MPKRVSKHPSDINQAAFLMVERSTSASDTKPAAKRETKVTPAEISRVMSAMGRKGGRSGGLKSAAKLTSEQRKERALLAARARWAKRKK
jgi:hypothetical protein